LTFAKTVPLNFTKIDVQIIDAEWLTDKQISLHVLRLDKIDPVVSGNKWFKLQYYLQEALALQKHTVATFGGAWSNHIVAAAFACKQAGVQSIGIIRGEKAGNLSATLKAAQEFGMELIFVSREEYRNKEQFISKYETNGWYWIPEGGYGVAGAKGASEILSIANNTGYSHIIAAVGTGTMLAGLILSATAEQHVIGVSSMKGNASLLTSINDLISTSDVSASFQLIHDYHFGGYGKHPEQLLDFINEVYHTHHLPLDIVYTGKTFFAIKDLVKKSFFKPGSRLLMIHSGGLQGNRSLPEKVLAF